MRQKSNLALSFLPDLELYLVLTYINLNLRILLKMYLKNLVIEVIKVIV